MLDLKIVNGVVVDGTGSARYAADVNIRDGRIVSFGASDEPATKTIDAGGRIVAPGFIDVHTHYDAQAFWDPSLSPSSFHGVTTLFGGFCGFTIAPLSEESGPYLMRMLARVEGIPLESLQEGVPWDWKTFEEYLQRLDGRLAVNAGFLCGHSALRRYVMGPRAVSDVATPEDISAMQALLRESIRGGALGFSTSLSITHSDGDGNPVPSRFATLDETLALFSVVSEFEGALAEMAPNSLDFTSETYDVLTRASLAARRPINWNLLTSSGRAPEEQARVANLIGASEHAEAQGGRVVALALPQTPRVRLNMVGGVLFDAIPGWAQLFGLPIEQRKQELRNPDRLRVLEEGAQSMTGMLEGVGDFKQMQVSEVFAAENDRYRGRLVGEIADEEGRTPFEVFVAIALADDLRTGFTISYLPDTLEMYEERAKLWRSRHTVIGGGDAGAHLDMIDTFAISTELLGQGVRERGVIGLEEAVHLLTLKSAEFMGLRERGQIKAGWHADIVIFDADHIAAGPTYMRTDLPGNGMRMYADAVGIHHVIVNGQEIIRDNVFLDATPGTILRPGVATRTVPIPADMPDTTQQPDLAHI